MVIGLKGVEREAIIKGENMIKMYYTHVWKNHNEPSHTVPLICTHKNVKNGDRIIS
jgi:hypothetical protein